MKKTSSFYTRLILSYAALLVLVMVLSISIADAFFIRAFKTFLSGGYGSPFGIESMVIEPKTYLLTATYLKFHDMMRLSVWIGGCAVMLIALGVASWFTRRFSQPISGFAGFADRIGHGDYDAQISDNQGLREFAELSNSLNHMAHELKCRDEVEQELFSNLSHELRTPVTVIKGYMEALDAELISSPQELHSAAEAISQETANLEIMINELRQLAQIDNNAVTPEASDFDVDEVLGYIWRRFAPIAAVREVLLSHQFEANVRVHLDRQLLDRAVANLLSNAITATPSGHSVTLSSAIVGSHGVNIVVEDTGSGIPKEDLAHVFDRFFRGDRSRNKRSGGLGLGLPIARDLVEIEGGHLDIKSTVGVGTRVTISYPRSVITRDESLLAS
ncbi:sensor histidine kinase [Candidatus Cryosericum odellii]|uniref:histidine kinase n=1 Tax=Candidatus Cryosericum odellii TaxID=2290917 RepID=A0A398D7A8_9BACT|nr:HAMP domain-containing sensor histidine kinase [Candidatus Cryosericum odellii]RIE10533.1 sensor histidine kinase [Candidatus Cryosericum odellii]RIE15460.1 sensor histidine kinase [Candidatus Cryosericum odellii]